MTQVKYKKNIVIATIAIIAIGLAITPTIFNNEEAQAQVKAGKVRYVTGSGHGDITCPSLATTGSIFFESSRSQGAGGGYWYIVGDYGGGKDGYITSVSITGKSFTLQGIENNDYLCGEHVPTSITIKGTCGSSATIQFTATNGERGSFTSQEVVCQ